MTISYAAAHDLLESFVRARAGYDGDALTALFTPDAQMVVDPFATPLAGHNALRAYLLAAADAERWYESAIERHWVSGDTALAVWHAGWTRRSDEAKVRQAGFLSAEVGGDGRILRLRLWTVTRDSVAAEGSADGG
jgi:ketosteroid isomerase-like protein